MMLRQSERGFTLVDALVAMAVLAIGMAGVGTMLHDSMRANLYSVSDRTSDAVAQEIMDDLKGQLAQLAFNEVQYLTLTNPKFNPPLYETTGQAGGINFVDKRGMFKTYVYQWRAEQQLKGGVPGNTENMAKVSVVVAYDTAQTAASFPRDPGDRNFWRYKTRIVNFVMTR